jgi:uncharacterized protein (DUF983 family)
MPELIHPLAQSIGRGFVGRCPACGGRGLFRKYLKVADRCPACALELVRYPADDGPAYLTILLIGHLVVAPMLLFPIVWRSPPQIALPIVLTALTIVTLSLLPRIKGGWIGLMYALGVTSPEAPLPTAD